MDTKQQIVRQEFQSVCVVKNVDITLINANASFVIAVAEKDTRRGIARPLEKSVTIADLLLITGGEPVRSNKRRLNA